MGTISRTTKAGSGTGDFAAGTTIVASEANADLNTLYNEINGALDANNLAANAVGTSEIQNSAVTTAKIADSNVTTAKIADANVTRAKLATNARSQAASTAATPSLAFNTTETTLASTSITTTGGRVLSFPSFTLYANIIAATAGTVTVVITIRCYRDSTLLFTYQRTVGNVNPTYGIPGVPIPLSVFSDAPAAGTYTYSVSAQGSSGSATLFTESTAPGALLCVEVP